MLNLGGRFVNQWAYQSPSGVVLVDTGYQNGYPRFRRRLARHGIPLSQVRYVFLTHAHDDHAGFLNEILRDAPDCRVILSPRSIPVLRRGQNSFSGGCTSRLALRFCRWMAAAGRGSHRFPPLEERFLSRCIPPWRRNWAGKSWRRPAIRRIPFPCFWRTGVSSAATRR